MWFDRGTTVPDDRVPLVLTSTIDGVVVQRLDGGRGCHKFVPVSGGDKSKIAPRRDLCDPPSGGMS